MSASGRFLKTGNLVALEAGVDGTGFSRRKFRLLKNIHKLVHRAEVVLDTSRRESFSDNVSKICPVLRSYLILEGTRAIIHNQCTLCVTKVNMQARLSRRRMRVGLCGMRYSPALQWTSAYRFGSNRCLRTNRQTRVVPRITVAILQSCREENRRDDGARDNFLPREIRICR